ncbi:hypothetical protein BRI9_3256 [plant metagenome]
MMKQGQAALLFAAALGGCTSMQGPSLPKLDVALNAQQLIAKAAVAQNDYSDKFNALAVNGDYIGLGLIGLAAGAAGSLIYGASTDVIAGIGLAAGTTLAVQNHIGSASSQNVYLQGHQALECFIQNASPFVQHPHAQGVDGLTLQIAALRRAVLTLDEQEILAKSMRADLDQGKQLTTDLEKSVAAWKAHPQRLRANLLAIQYKVISTLRQQRTIDFNQLLGQLNTQAIAAAAGAKTPAPGAARLGPNSTGSAALEQAAAASTTIQTFATDADIVNTLDADLPGALTRADACAALIP